MTIDVPSRSQRNLYQSHIPEKSFLWSPYNSVSNSTVSKNRICINVNRHDQHIEGLALALLQSQVHDYKQRTKDHTDKVNEFDPLVKFIDTICFGLLLFKCLGAIVNFIRKHFIFIIFA